MSFHLFSLSLVSEVHLPDRSTPVGTLVQPGGQTTQLSVSHKQSSSDHARQDVSGGLVIPDMTKVFFKESYEDRVRKVTIIYYYVTQTIMYTDQQL